MKTIYLFVTAICAFATTILAEEPTMLFYETFDIDAQCENRDVLDMTIDAELVANTILGTDAYKVDGNYYFGTEEDKLQLINLDFLDAWGDSELWPNASRGGVGCLQLSYDAGHYKSPAYRIKLSTKDFAEAYFSAAYNMGWSSWASVEFSYSFDLGTTWQVFNMADRTDYTQANWRHLSFKENIGGQEVVYLKAEAGTEGGNTFDDLKVVGYGRIGIDNTTTKQLAVYPCTSGLAVHGVAAGEVIAVYNAAGILVATAVAGEGETSIPLPANGTYIVKAAGKAVKVVL